MQADIILKNYRCFPDEKPLRFSLRKGFTSLLGANNSGKSSLLKFFWEFRDLFAQLSSPPREVRNFIEGRAISFQFIKAPITDPKEVFSNVNNRDLTFELKFSGPLTLDDVQALHLTVSRENYHFSGKLFAGGRWIDASSAGGDGFDRFLGTRGIFNFGDVEMGHVFQTFDDLSKAIYIGAFRNIVNVGGGSQHQYLEGPQDYFDIVVGEPFVKQWAHFKSGSSVHQAERAYRLTKDIERVFGFSDLQINPFADGKTLHLLINGKSYKLAEAGSALTQFIIVLANVAIKEPTYVLIDEPELNLHPTLQIDFLTTIEQYAKKGVIFATHNVGLARSCAEQIYSFRYVHEGVCEVGDFEKAQRLPLFLGELSYSGYQALGFETLLLVEGSTDILTFHQLLRKYGKDHKVVVLSLGGSDTINGRREAELREVKRVSEKVSAVIDSERIREGDALTADRQDFVDLCNNLGIQCKVLDRRSTENYLSEAAVKRVKGSKYGALASYEKREEVDRVWGKNENWRIAREMTRQELDATDLGTFLQDL